MKTEPLNVSLGEDELGQERRFNGDGHNGNGKTDTIDPRTMVLEALLAQAENNRYIVVRLGENQAIMGEVAEGVREALHSERLKSSMPPGYAQNVDVLVAADTVHAIQYLQEKEYHRVSGIIMHPEEVPEGDHLLRVLNGVDTHRVIDLSQKPSIFAGGVVNKEALLEEVIAILRHNYNVLQEVISNYLPKGEVLSSGLLPPARIGQNDITLEGIIETREGLKDAWAARKNAESINTKRAIEAKRPRQQVTQVVPEDIQKAIQALAATDYPALKGQEYAAPVPTDPKDPDFLNDTRRLSKELGELVEIISSSVGAGGTPGLTHFYRYATKGIIGLFDENVQATPEQKFIWVKPYNTAAEVQALFHQFLFNQFDLQRDRGINVLHEPLAYHYSERLDQYFVISRAPLLAITAEVANQVKKLGPDFFDGYLGALMEIGFEQLVKYKGTAQTGFDAKQRTLILHGYKAKAITAKDDLERATGEKLSEAELRLFLESLGTIFDDVSLWDPQLFGPIMDYKPYNNGNRLGVIRPSPELVRAVLFGGRTTQPERESVTRSMRETYGILEHEGRPGITLEDSSHMIDSPELLIEPAKRPHFFVSYITAVMPNATDRELSGVWPAYFGMEEGKTIRKMQRTVHYMITNFRNAPREEVGKNFESYLEGYRTYAGWLAQTAYAAVILTSQHLGDKFDQQVKVVSQLYSEREPKLPSSPGALAALPRAFYGTFVALQRLLELEPKAGLLRRLDVLR
ncbi:hypothetical protein HYV83_01995 [Candidatus Woesearchaeota archaeon]|nr:hypothetical protein [Candidatus Woesearchaeota archaeon]